MSGRAAPALAAGAALLTLSCGVPLMSLPSGPGAPADASAALADATRACRAVQTFTAAIAVRGSIGGQTVRARLFAGLAPPASVRIEAIAPFGQPTFTVVAVAGDATVVLSDGRALEHGPPSEVLEALTGVPIAPADLRPVLTGCAEAPAPERARQFGADWFVVPDDAGTAYLHRESAQAPWRLVAAERRPPGAGGWRTEYRDVDGGLPRSVRFKSEAAGRFDLRLSLSQVALNDTLGADVFRLQVPADAAPITLDELRRSAPWAADQ